MWVSQVHMGQVYGHVYVSQPSIHESGVDGSARCTWVMCTWVSQEPHRVCTIRYDSVYLTCSKKLTGSQLSLPHGTNKKLTLKKIQLNEILHFNL